MRRAGRLPLAMAALVLPVALWSGSALASQARYVVFAFDAGGRGWVHMRDANLDSTGRQALTGPTVAWAQKTIFSDSWRKVQLTGSGGISVSEVVGFATREEASAYHWSLEQRGRQPWQNSHRPAAGTQPPNPDPSPGPDPAPWNPWESSRPLPQPQPQPQPQRTLQPLRGALSFSPQYPVAGERIQFQLNAVDPNDPGWPDWRTAWYAGGQLVGGTGTGATQVGFGIVNPGVHTISVQVRNERTGAAGTFSAVVQVRQGGGGTTVPGTAPPLFGPQVPGWEPLNPDEPGAEPPSRRRSGGRVPGLGGFGRLPGARDMFQALVGVLGPGAMALILHILSTLFGGSGGGGSTSAPLAVRIPDGPAESGDGPKTDEAPSAGDDAEPPPGEPEKPPNPPERPGPSELSKPAGDPARRGRPQWTDAERARLMAVLQNLQQAARREGRDVSLLGEFLGAVKGDAATVPGWLLDVVSRAAGEVGDARNWRIAGETLAGTADDLLVHSDEGARKVGRAALDAGRLLLALGQRAGSALWNDPLDALRQGARGALELGKALLGVDNWSKVVDGEVPLGERLARALYGAADSGLTLWGAGSKLSEWMGRAGAAEWRGVLRAPGLADAADDALDAARVAGHADGLGDAERAAARMEQAGDYARRQAAWDQAMRQATDKVDEFESALLGGDRDRVRRAMIEIQNDKVALQEINARGNNIKRLYKDGWQEVYDKTDDLVRAEIAGRYGVDPSDVRLVTPTNPTPPGAPVKVGADRDVTYRIFKEVDGRPVCFDVEHGYGQEVYDRAFHQAAEGAKHSPGATPRQFAGGCDQLVTSAQHADAYGDSPVELEKILRRPEAPLKDPTQIGQVMGYKSQEVYQHVDELRDRIAALRRSPGGGAEAAAEAARLEAQSERLLFEGMRQNTKQWNNQVLRRVAALEAQGQQVEVPARLREAVDVLAKVKPGGASPSQAGAELAALGTTPDRVAYETGKFIESLEKLRPRPPGVWSRLASGLAGLLGGAS